MASIRCWLVNCMVGIVWGVTLMCNPSKNVASIIANNPGLEERFTLRRQQDKNHMFEGIIQAGERF